MKVRCEFCGWEGKRKHLDHKQSALNSWYECPKCGKGSDDSFLTVTDSDVGRNEVQDVVGSVVEDLLGDTVHRLERKEVSWGVGHKIRVGNDDYRYLLRVHHESSETFQKMEQAHREALRKQAEGDYE